MGQAQFNETRSGPSHSRDPVVPDWKNVRLPDTWPDTLHLGNPRDLASFLGAILGGKRARIELPDDLPGRERIPRYVLQEFHNLPNGFYSRRMTHAYMKGFDRAMLGEMGRVRKAMAERLAHLNCVLDVGCGGGHTAAAIRAAGVREVWGIDPSPYLLQQAATTHPGVRFVQGLAEDTGFAAQRFDGIAACFLLHEIPPRFLAASLEELHRILKPAGELVVSEPSRLQLDGSFGSRFRDWGWRGIYFNCLARFVHEPFVDAWHRVDVRSRFAEHGFELLEDLDRLPVRSIHARKIG